MCGCAARRWHGRRARAVQWTLCVPARVKTHVKWTLVTLGDGGHGVCSLRAIANPDATALLSPPFPHLALCPCAPPSCTVWLCVLRVAC